MTISGFYNAYSVLLCLSMTVTMVLGIILLACCIKDEMFWCYGVLMASIMGTGPILVFNYLNLFNASNSPYQRPWLMTLFGYLFTVLAAVYIIYDVDSITSRQGISIDDYILAALFLFTDIINLFMCVL